jgi:flagellar motor switch protein FliN/FliY
MNGLPDIRVKISVVVGATKMPIRQLLKMGRGAVIALDTKHNDPVDIYANDELIARGQIVVTGERIQVRLTERIKRKGSDAKPLAA